MNRSQCADFVVDTIIAMNGESRFDDLLQLLVQQLPRARQKSASSLLAEGINQASRNNRVTRRPMPGQDAADLDKGTRYIYQVGYGFKKWGYGYNGWPTQTREET